MNIIWALMSSWHVNADVKIKQGVGYSVEESTTVKVKSKTTDSLNCTTAAADTCNPLCMLNLYFLHKTVTWWLIREEHVLTVEAQSEVKCGFLYQCLQKSQFLPLWAKIQQKFQTKTGSQVISGDLNHWTTGGAFCKCSKKHIIVDAESEHW